MPSRISAWAIYDVFTVKGGEQIFLAVVSDTQWAIFCDAFGFADLKANPQLTSNNDRVRAREWLMQDLRHRLANHSAAELSAKFEANSLPFAPITQPEDLFNDPHLKQTGGLAPITLPDGRETETILLPLMMDSQRLGIRANPPRLGEHSRALLASVGYSATEIEALYAQQISTGA